MNGERIKSAGERISHTHMEKVAKIYTDAADLIRKENGEVEIPELAEKLNIKEETAWLYML